MSKSRTVSKLHVRYKRFQKDQRDIWESFCLIDYYAPKIKDAIKSDIFPPLVMETIWGNKNRELSKDNTYGAISSLSRKGNYRRTLLEAVLVFEDYMTDLIQIVYLDYPTKLVSNTNDDGNNSSHNKLVRLIMESTDKQEMIDKLVEEKIRGIFYGNPLSVFEKDKAKLEFGTFFKEHHKCELNKFKTIVAMRNIVAHNNGKIDRKYIREADKNAQLGAMLSIKKGFLKEAVYVLSLLAAHSTRLVVENIYKEIPQGKLGQALNKFTKKC